MGYLDDLKRKSETLKAEEQVEKERLEKLEVFYRAEIVPKLESIYTLLYEMAEHLNYVKPDTRVSFQLAGYGVMSNLLQSQYKVKADSRKDMKNILLSFYCMGEGDFSFEIQEKKNIRRQTDYLGLTGLTFQSKSRKNVAHEVTDAVYTIENKVPVGFEFVADIESSAIQLTIKNFETFDRRTMRLIPKNIDNDFLDRLARYIVRDEINLFQTDISSEAKTQLQEKIQQERKQRDEELIRAEQREQWEIEQKQGLKKNKMLDMFKKLGKKE